MGGIGVDYSDGRFHSGAVKSADMACMGFLSGFRSLYRFPPTLVLYQCNASLNFIYSLGEREESVTGASSQRVVPLMKRLRN